MFHLYITQLKYFLFNRLGVGQKSKYDNEYGTNEGDCNVCYI